MVNDYSSSKKGILIICTICLLCNIYLIKTCLSKTLLNYEERKNDNNDKVLLNNKEKKEDKSVSYGLVSTNEQSSILLSSGGRIAISSENFSLNNNNRARTVLGEKEINKDNSKECFSIGDNVLSSSAGQEKGNLWWRVDLDHVANIDKIKISNRADCCANELNNFYVIVTNDNKIRNLSDLKETNSCGNGVQSNTEIGKTLEINCNNIEGRYVYVYGDKEIGKLTICKLQVYGMYKSVCSNIGTSDECHMHAKCVEDNITKLKVCKCTEGYEGDGVISCGKLLDQFSLRTANVLLDFKSKIDVKQHGYTLDKQIAEKQVITDNFDLTNKIL